MFRSWRGMISVVRYVNWMVTSFILDKLLFVALTVCIVFQHSIYRKEHFIPIVPVRLYKTGYFNDICKSVEETANILKKNIHFWTDRGIVI